jgi:hypothetical protein
MQPFIDIMEGWIEEGEIIPEDRHVDHVNGIAVL